jgi:putative phage-type endonuclease
VTYQARTLPLCADRDEWVAQRRDGIGGSDAAAVVGLDPFRSPLMLWLEKTGRAGDSRDSEAMALGRALEPTLRDVFSERTGLFVTLPDSALVHPEYDYVRCNLDGLVYESGPAFVVEGEPLGIFEAKTAGLHDPERATRWRIQVLHNLAVTGCDHAWLCSLSGGRGGMSVTIEEVERNDADIAVLLDIEHEFWWRHVVADVPPPGLGYPAEAPALAQAFPGGDVDGFELDEHGRELLFALRVAKGAAKETGEVLARAEVDMRAYLGDREVALCDGIEAVTYKAHERRSLDTAALRADHADLVAKYERPQSVRRLLVKEAS